MIEKNEIAKKIEDLMGFEFEKLELIGHVTTISRTTFTIRYLKQLKI